MTKYYGKVTKRHGNSWVKCVWEPCQPLSKKDKKFHINTTMNRF